MHKLNLFTGGHKRSLNDLQQLQDQSADIMKALALVYSDNPATHSTYILSGLLVTYTSLTFNVSAGWIWMDNEVWFVPAWTANEYDFDFGVYFRKVATNGANNPVVYANSVSHAAHVNNTLSVFSLGGTTGLTMLPVSTVAAGDAAFSSMHRAEEYFALKIQKQLRTPFTGLAVNSAGVTGTLYWRTDGLLKTGYLNGLLTVSSAASLPNPGTYVTPVNLPAAAMPAALHTFSAQVSYNGGWVAGPSQMPSITALNCELHTFGALNVGLIKAATASSYQFRISTSYPLD